MVNKMVQNLDLYDNSLVLHTWGIEGKIPTENQSEAAKSENQAKFPKGWSSNELSYRPHFGVILFAIKN